MSTIVSVEDRGSQEYKVLCKGAPEVVKKYLKEVPSGYDRCYLKYVKNGARVLVLAHKTLPKKQQDFYLGLKREEVESDLTFCGFIVSDCPLKPDTKAVISHLTQSSHEVRMITGDNQLTAAFIGKELQFGPTHNGSLFAKSAGIEVIHWVDIEETPIRTTSSA